MKVVKFGGTSVGSVQGLENVRKIVLSSDEPVIVVVSAFSGVTDRLLGSVKKASKGDSSYMEDYDFLCRRHFDMIDSLFPGETVRCSLKEKISPVLSELKLLLEGVFALRVVPEKTGCQIASMGERMSSVIIASLIDGAVHFNSLELIKTHRVAGKNVLEAEQTYSLVKKAFEGFTGIAVVPGFISTDSVTGDITTLGRGGSDYTASIIAAAVDAAVLEIWTDVDGFMTADPRIVKDAFVIDSLSYAEAMELCHFGAKVIFAPALYPVFPKDIPIYVKNTFNSSFRGTLIEKTSSDDDRIVSGITSIDKICLLTLKGPSLAGIVGVDSRLFSSLKRKEISVFLVTQSSSETGISVGVTENCAETARRAIEEEFANEIGMGLMNEVLVERELASLSVVGPEMKRSKGIASKLFTALSKRGISVLACAQGSSEHNISIIIKSADLRLALNSIHESYFHPLKREINLFVCGIGTVGGELLRQIEARQGALLEEKSLRIKVAGISRSNRSLFNPDGINLAGYREEMDASGIETTPEKVLEFIKGMGLPDSVFVDCTSSGEIAALYGDLLSDGISVVAANKIAASSDYARYSELKMLAKRSGAGFLFETNVGAGLPVINTINALRNSGDVVEKIEAVVSGTLNFIFSTLSSDICFSETVRQAKEKGYSEPDPRIDLSAKDVVRKLVILSREAGYEVSEENISVESLIPGPLFAGSEVEFWQNLPKFDEEFEKKRVRAEVEGKRLRYVAKMEKGKCSVTLEAVGCDHPFYSLYGSNNCFLITTGRYHDSPLMIQGYGAGATVTAAGVFADILSIVGLR